MLTATGATFSTQTVHPRNDDRCSSKQIWRLPSVRPVAAPIVVKHYVLYPFFFRRSRSSFLIRARGS